MKSGIKQIVGKRISAIVTTANGRRSPKQQLFLVFSDGTQLEIYGENFNCASGLDEGGIERAVRYAGVVGCEVMEVIDEASAADRDLLH